jgi:lambda repressor-like predicted transcriptional regulator
MWNVVNALANSCVKQKMIIDDFINLKQQEIVNEL